jgi:hypothetical protein
VEGYPTYSEFIGPYSTSQHSEIESIPLSHQVSSYNQGFYEKIIEEPKQKTSFISKLFRRGHAHEDFPKSEVYQGPISIINKNSELTDTPISQFSSIYHSKGFYDELPKQEVYKEESKFDLIATTKPSYLADYPTNERFEGNLESIHHNELSPLPISNEISVYHSGQSDLEPIKKDSSFKIPSFFKKSTHEYPPISEPFTGQLESTIYARNIEDQPLNQNVNVYSSGVYDQLEEKPKLIVGEPETIENVKEFKGKFFIDVIFFFN